MILLDPRPTHVRSLKVHDTNDADWCNPRPLHIFTGGNDSHLGGHCRLILKECLSRLGVIQCCPAQGCNTPERDKLFNFAAALEGNPPSPPYFLTRIDSRSFNIMRSTSEQTALQLSAVGTMRITSAAHWWNLRVETLDVEQACQKSLVRRGVQTTLACY